MGDNEFADEHAARSRLHSKAEAGLRYLDRDTTSTSDRLLDQTAARAVLLAGSTAAKRPKPAIRKAIPNGSPRRTSIMQSS
jgi:hypothetical protein